MDSPSASTYFKTLARLAARRFRDGNRADLTIPRQRLVAERWRIGVAPRRLARYLAVTEGKDIAGFRAEDPLLPPVFPVVWEAGLILELLTHPEVPVPTGGLIHLESEICQLRPLRGSDSIRCRVELDGAEADPRGVRLSFLSRNWNGGGQLASEHRAVLLLRGPAHGAKRDRTAGRDARATDGAEAWEEIARWRLKGSHGRRYARVSGDYNPIHLWGLTARPFGYRRPVLHGFCIQALAAHALIEQRCAGDPTGLRRLQIRFRSPLLLPAATRLVVADNDGEGHGGRFRVVAATEEEKVYAEGEFGGGRRM